MGWMQAQQKPNSCVYGNIFMNTTRSLHTNVTSRIAYAAPPELTGRYQDTTIDPSSIGALLQNVNNPVNSGQSQKTRKTSSSDSWTSSKSSSKSSRTSSSLDSAVADFSFTIGEIEYQFAVQDLQAENFKSAVNHLKLATTHHHPAATFNLGLCYERGLGVTRDLKMAMHCYTVASSLGHSKAMYNLGVFYVRGLGGLKRSKKAARECFDSAARLGQPEAQTAMDMIRRQKESMSGNDEPKLMSAVKDVGFGVHAF